MLARIRKSIDEKDQGFTLIELLVVMIIIGILAAIAIPVFLNQRKKAADTQTKSDVTSIGKEVATYYVDNTTNPTSFAKSGSNTWQIMNGATVLATVGRVTDPNTMSVPTPTTGAYGFTSATSWCVSVHSTAGTQDYKYSAAGGLQSGNCVSGTDY